MVVGILGFSGSRSLGSIFGIVSEVVLVLEVRTGIYFSGIFEFGF